MKNVRDHTGFRYCGNISSVSSFATGRSITEYKTIKSGIKKCIPAAILLWAFHKVPSRHGLTSRTVIGFLKQHFKLAKDPKRTGQSISNVLRSAVEFGLLEKRGNKYFLAKEKLVI